MLRFSTKLWYDDDDYEEVEEIVVVVVVVLAEVLGIGVVEYSTEKRFHHATGFRL